MAIEKVDVHKFIELAKLHPVLDARSPGEFCHAHFPNAYNLALFSDEERKVVGTAYKQQGRQEAIKIGLVYFGVKMKKMVEEVEAIIAHLPSKEPEVNCSSDDGPNQVENPVAVRNHPSAIVLVHCWRGGMRSRAIAWLLDLYGFKVYLLHGGYKKFRHYVLETFRIPFPCKILGGFTGSGKTYIISELARHGYKTIDLEGLANHKGSAFGTLGPQPSQEMFENVLALQLRDKSAEKSSLTIADSIWLEDESQRIGAVIIPPDLWSQMRHSPLFFLDIPFEERLEHIIREYGAVDKQNLADAILRIQKRLGGLETKKSIKLLMENDIRESFRILLKYYDRCYSKSSLNKPAPEEHKRKIACDTVDKNENTFKLIKALNSKQLSF